MRRFTIFAIALAALVFAQASLAAVLPPVSETGFGTVGQGAAGIGSYDPPNAQGIKNVACGPTSVYNSFLYLQTNFPNSGLGNLTLPAGGGNSSAANTINQLAMNMGLVPNVGVSANGFINGKTQYIRDRGLQNVVSVESTQSNDPKVMLQFIYDQLKKGQDVEIGFTWNQGRGGHIVEVTGMTGFDPATGMGTLQFNDPWGDNANPAVPDGTSSQETGALNGLTLTYNASGDGDAIAGGADQGGDFAGAAAAGTSGTIRFAAAESVVPLPGTVWGGMLLFGGVVFLHYRSRKASRLAA